MDEGAESLETGDRNGLAVDGTPWRDVGSRGGGRTTRLRSRLAVIAAVSVGVLGFWLMTQEGRDPTTYEALGGPVVGATSDSVGTPTSGSVATSTVDPVEVSTSDSVATTASDIASSGIPATFWALKEADTGSSRTSAVDVVELSTTDRTVLRRLDGFGALRDLDIDGPVLVAIEAGPDGRLWLEGCCVPQVGRIWAVDPATATSGLEAEGGSLFGRQPVVSPDGTRVAALSASEWSAGGVYADDTHVALSDAVDGRRIAVIPPDAVFGPDGPGGGSPTPIGWVDDDTLVAFAGSFDGPLTWVLFIDVTGPFAPTVEGRVELPDAWIVGGGRNVNGDLVVGATNSGVGDARMLVIDRNAHVVTEKMLPRSTTDLDVSADGTVVLVTTEAGVIFLDAATGEVLHEIEVEVRGATA